MIKAAKAFMALFGSFVVFFGIHIENIVLTVIGCIICVASINVNDGPNGGTSATTTN